MQENLLSCRSPPYLKHKKRTTVCLLVLVASLIINHYLHSEFMQISVQISIYLQTLNLELMSRTLSTVAIAGALSYIPLNAFLSSKKLQAFEMLIGLILCCFFQSLIKMIYMDQRPSFLSKELKTGRHFCEKEYGMPSGHALFSAFAFFCIAKQYKRKCQHMSIFQKTVVIGLIIIIGLGVVFSRLYFGVHSLNQVGIGLILGTFLFTLTNSVEKYLDVYVIAPVFKIERTYLSRHISLFLGFVGVGMVMILMFAFLLSFEVDYASTEFYKEIINCVEVKEDFNFGFSVKVLRDGLTFAYFLGILVGIGLHPESLILEFNFGFDGNAVNTMVRLGCVFLINLPMYLMMEIEFKSVGMRVLRPLILFPLFGVLTGRYSTDFIRWCGIPLGKQGLIENKGKESKQEGFE